METSVISPDASLTPSQIRAAELLTMGKISKEVAKIVGVTPETISKWKQKPAFRALCQEMRLLALSNTVAEINNLNSLAENTLRELMWPGVSEILCVRRVETIRLSDRPI